MHFNWRTALFLLRLRPLKLKNKNKIKKPICSVAWCTECWKMGLTEMTSVIWIRPGTNCFSEVLGPSPVCKIHIPVQIGLCLWVLMLYLLPDTGLSWDNLILTPFGITTVVFCLWHKWQPSFFHWNEGHAQERFWRTHLWLWRLGSCQGEERRWKPVAHQCCSSRLRPPGGLWCHEGMERKRKWI